MPLAEMLGLILAAAAGGAVNAVAGGGTLITFPALLFFGTPPVIANATSTLALVAGTSGGIYGYRQHIAAVKPWLARFVPVSLLGGLLGAILLTHTSNQTFSKLVPFLILFATLLFLTQSFFRSSKFKVQSSKSKAQISNFKSRISKPGDADHATRNTQHATRAGRLRERERLRLRLSPPFTFHASRITHHAWPLLFQFLVSLYGGYFGAGIGILMLASLGFMGLSHIHEMNTLKTILSSLINLVAAVWFIFAGLIHWPKAGLMTMGALAGYFLGSHFSQRIPQARVRQIITLAGFILSAATFYKQFVR
jgi:uncharacterized membrane protein YfcA